MHNIFSAYLAEMTEIPSQLDGGFYLALLWFIDSQVSVMQSLVQKHDANRLYVLKQLLPLWQMIWSTMHTALRRFDPADGQEQHERWARAALEGIDSLDRLWLPLVVIVADPTLSFDHWAERFRPKWSFVDDDLIEDLMLFLPALENVEYNRVRRVLWLRERALNQESKEKREDEEHAEDETSNSDFEEASEESNERMAGDRYESNIVTEASCESDDDDVASTGPESIAAIHEELDRNDDATLAHNPAILNTVTTVRRIVICPTQAIETFFIFPKASLAVHRRCRTVVKRVD